MTDAPWDVQLLAEVVDRLAVGLYVVNARGRAVLVNPQAATLLGWSQAELLGRDMHRTIHARPTYEASSASACPITAAARSGRPARADEDTFWHRSGAPLTVWWAAQAITSPAPAVVVAFDELVRAPDGQVLHQLAAHRAEIDRQHHAHRRTLAGAERLALLAQLGEALSTLDVEQGLARLARLVVGRVADWCVVDTIVDGAVQRAAFARSSAAGRDAPVLLGPLPALTAQSSGPVASVLRGGDAVEVVAADAVRRSSDLFDRTVSALYTDLGAAAVLVAPIRARHMVLGAITWGRTDAAVGFTEADVTLASELGHRAGLSLDNARLFHQQRRAAETLQRSLLSVLPEPDHLQLAARYLPAGEGLEVGGDWYDGLVLPSGATVLVIGDVVGHDTAATARMAQLRHLLRGCAVDHDEPPAALLSRLDMLVERLRVDGMATCLVARIEQSEDDRGRGLRHVRWSSAGHPPPVLLLDDGSVRVLDELPDLLLGVDASTSREDHVAALPPGSTLLLYTDGLVERRGAGLDHGITRLRRAVGALAALPLEQLCDELVARLVPEGHAEDDVALIAVRAHPEDRPRPPEAGPSHLG